MRAALVPLVLILTLCSCASTPEPGLALADEYYNLGNEWFDLKKFDKAGAAYQKALSWNSGLKIAALNWARTKAELGDVAGALALLKPVADSDPENLVVGQYVAWLTGKQDGPAAAADLYAALARRLPGDAATQFNAGLSLWAAKRSEEARAALTVWKSLDGKSWGGLSLLAEVQEAEGSPDAAQTWLEAANTFGETDVKRFDPLTRRAKALETAERFGEASEAWKSAVAFDAPEAAKAEARFRLGSVLMLKLEDYAAGLEAVLLAWKGGYKDADAWKGLQEKAEVLFGPKLEADLKLAEVKP